MGIPIPPIFVPPVAVAGNSCPICWGSGKPFGDGPTPEKIYITFSGINKGPNWTSHNGEPKNESYELGQVGVLPCTFSVLDAPIGIKVEFRAGQTEIFFEDLGISIYFSAVVGASCQTFIFNEEADIFTGGSCVLYIPEVN